MPSLTELDSLERKDGTTFSVMDELGSDYKKVALQLLDDKNGTIMENIKEDKTKVADIKEEIFRRWRNGTGMKPATWRTLVTLLESGTIQRGTLALEIRNALE